MSKLDWYVDYLKKQADDKFQLEEAYKSAVAWLALSAMLNAALLGAWLWEVVQ